MAGFATIPPHLPFLDRLARGLLAREGGGPERLGDVLLLLPSRRACGMARDAFLRAAGGRPTLLPRALPVGEVGEDELALDPAGAAAGLPDAIEPLRRRLLLTRLVLAQGRAPDGGRVPHEQAVRLAGALASLLDELGTERVPPGALERLVPGEHAAHWERTLGFLRLLETAWPAVLAEDGRLDPAERRNRLLDAVAARWEAAPPPHPIVAAGVTGSVPAVARLLAAVARLPEGLVVLPGLDRELDARSWEALPPSHPQAALRRLLAIAGVDRAAVAGWPDGAEGARGAPRGGPPGRVALLREVMRPAATSGGLAGLALPPDAFLGVEVEEHRDLAGEAATVALRARAALEDPAKRVAVVTPDRNLARRVAVELRRFGIDADDSAGVPLDQSPPGVFLLLTAHLLAEAAPVPLLAALKHPLAAGGTDPGAFRRRVRALERAALRGPRPAGGLPGLAAALRARASEAEAAAARRDPSEPGGWPAAVPPDELLSWLDGLIGRAEPFVGLAAGGEAPFAALMDAHLAFALWLSTDDGEDAAPALWSKAAGVEARGFVASLRAAAPLMGRAPATAYPALLAVLMGSVQVRTGRPGHPRVSILGQLESRLLEADLVLACGLVEGAWPAAVDGGPWLNRRMREDLGLPAVEQAVGLAAHDLVGLAAAPELVLSRSRKDAGGAPATASRWLQRLRALARAAGREGELRPSPDWARWAASLDAPPGGGEAVPCPAPEPRPPLAARPRDLWATDVEHLLRNPYAHYARRVLGLRPLDPIDAEPGALERGILLHRALHRFVLAWPDGLPPDPLPRLLEIGRELFAPLAHEPEVAAVWWPRFVRVAEWFVERERGRRAEARRILTEVEGRLVVDAPGGPVTLRARADRVELGRDGSVRVLDYKTGSLPAPDRVAMGFSPQLTVEGLIAAAGGFPGVPAGGPELLLLYWRLSGGSPAGEERLAAGKRRLSDELLAEAKDGLARLLAHFDDPEAAYLAVPRPEVGAGYDPYEHLARIAEWRGWGAGT